MAKAKVNTRTVEQIVDVSLSLSTAEASTLAEVLARVGGDPANTARRYATNIYKTLSDAGFNFRYDLSQETAGGNICFFSGSDKTVEGGNSK